MALPTPDVIPVRLAVTGEEDPGRGHGSRLALVDLGLAGKVAARHRLEPGHRPRHRDALVEEGADVVFCARGAEALEEAVAA